jgi:hypothetical protein
MKSQREERIWETELTTWSPKEMKKTWEMEPKTLSPNETKDFHKRKRENGISKQKKEYKNLYSMIRWPHRKINR